MAYNPVSGAAIQYSNENNELASGYYLKFYVANTTTPLSMATDGTGSVLLVRCKLNLSGLPITNELDDDSVFIPFVDQTYRLVIYKSEADADANNTANAFVNIADVQPMVGGDQLGSAAFLDAQTSLTDATDDRLMKVGAFGLGSITDSLSDYDVLQQAGFNLYTNVATPSPGSGSRTTLNLLTQSGAGAQLAARSVNNDFSMRSVNGATKADWVDLYHTGNLLGTVSESGGVPTGAVIERGSNANGEYVKFADGTLQCWLKEKTVVYDSTQRLLATFPLPAAFIDADYVGVASRRTSNGDAAKSLGASPDCFQNSTASITVTVYTNDGTSTYSLGDTAIVNIFASGRWF